MVDPWWHEVVSNLSHENWPLSSTTAILPKKWWTKPVPMSGFRDCVHNLYLQDLEIQGFDLIAQCVTIIGHAHTNKPQPALNKIQVRTSDECRYIKIKKSQEGLEAVYPWGKIVSLKHSGLRAAGPFRWWLQTAWNWEPSLRPKCECSTQEAFLCEMLGQQASEGGGNRLQNCRGRHRKSRWSSAVLTIPGNLWPSAGSWL